MAMEIEAGTWMFTDLFPKVGGVRREVEQPAFKPTPLHDLEPLLWMVIWTLDARYLDPKTPGSRTTSGKSSEIMIRNMSFFSDPMFRNG
jgi:hypothetical protein